MGLFDPYVWHPALKKRVQMTSDGEVLQINATLHYPDEVERLIKMLQIARGLFDEADPPDTLNTEHGEKG